MPRLISRFALRLSRSLFRRHAKTRQALLGSRPDLPCHAVRKHLGATGEWIRLRLHTADSTLPRLWPTGSSSGWPPSTTAQQFSSDPSDSTSRWTPCPPRLASGTARNYPRSLGYGSLHLRTRGTLTLLIRARPCAQCEPLRLPRRPKPISSPYTTPLRPPSERTVAGLQHYDFDLPPHAASATPEVPTRGCPSCQPRGR